MQKFHTIFFDLDGTLTDPAEGITNSVAYALEKYGIHVEDKRELNRFIGPPLAGSFTKFYGFSVEEGYKAVNVYREYYTDRGIFENKLYPGICEMLQSLTDSGRRVVLATSKPDVFAEKILEHFDIAKYFDFVAGATLTEKRTDKHEVIEYAIASLGIADRSGIVMVGDREHDVIGAKKSGLKSIGVLYGYGSEEELTGAGADHIVTNVTELINYLLSH